MRGITYLFFVWLYIVNVVSSRLILMAEINKEKKLDAQYSVGDRVDAMPPRQGVLDPLPLTGGVQR